MAFLDMRKLTILGATGSIGASTLKVVAENPEQFTIVALAAGQNVTKMRELCQIWQPKYAVMADAKAARRLMEQLTALHLNTEVLYGDRKSVV